MAFEFRRIKRWLLQAEPLATPMELALRPGVWREVFRKRRRIPLSQVRKFVRTNVGDGLEFFSAGKGASTLIVVFTGRTGRIFMPIAIFLQHLDDAKYDVLALYDLQDLHFDRGAGVCDSSFAALMDRVTGIARARGYRSIVTYGGSMGGFPALRGGHALKADRAISVGGSFAWHVSRLRSGGKTIAAFDPLCECCMPIRSRAYLLYAEKNLADSENAARASAIVRDAVPLPMPTGNHGFPFAIYWQGGLSEYHSQLFDLERTPDHQRLCSLLAGADRAAGRDMTEQVEDT